MNYVTQNIFTPLKIKANRNTTLYLLVQCIYTRRLQLNVICILKYRFNKLQKNTKNYCPREYVNSQNITLTSRTLTDKSVRRGWRVSTFMKFIDNITAKKIHRNKKKQCKCFVPHLKNFCGRPLLRAICNRIF